MDTTRKLMSIISKLASIIEELDVENRELRSKVKAPVMIESDGRGTLAYKGKIYDIYLTSILTDPVSDELTRDECGLLKRSTIYKKTFVLTEA